MLQATQREIEHVIEYMKSQAPDLTVQFVQKVYTEIERTRMLRGCMSLMFQVTTGQKMVPNFGP